MRSSQLRRFASGLSLLMALACSSESTAPPVDTDTDGDGLTDAREESLGTNASDPCDPAQVQSYTGYDPENTRWRSADCDGDGRTNGVEADSGTNPYADEISDSDGDGLTDLEEAESGTDPNDACDPQMPADYDQYNRGNPVWSGSDCDGDGLTNGQEVAGGTNPYADDITDSDGDGISDYQEELDGSDAQDPCDPAMPEGYDGYDPENPSWGASDCDGDGLTNREEYDAQLDPYADERLFAATEFMPTLSEMNIFEGPIALLVPGRTALEYELSTPLFTDYAHKLRTISLPRDGQMQLTGDGMLQFPDQTVITKTFYYYLDERSPASGSRIIETRVLILKNGLWQVGNYLWNDSQTEAFLDPDRHIVPMSWTDATGQVRSADYTVPNTNNCITCHTNNGQIQPIGPKARALNFERDGQNQLASWIIGEVLVEQAALNGIGVLPDWEDSALTLENRARAYMDINCAHCHQPGNNNYFGTLDLRYELAFGLTDIGVHAAGIKDRIASSVQNYRMPQIGTSIPHDEGIALINAYIDSLE